MAIWTPFNSFLGKPFDGYFRQATMPAADSYWVLLTNGGTIDPTSDLSTVLAQEVSGYGYARQACHFAPGLFDAMQSRFEYPEVTLTWNASGGAIQYDKAVLVANTTSTGTTGDLVLFYAESTPITIPDGTPRSLILTFNIGGATADVSAA